MNYTHQDMSLDDLIERLRKVGWIWFKNDDILLLEELFRRVKKEVK
jgi:hypothetical protein